MTESTNKIEKEAEIHSEFAIKEGFPMKMNSEASFSTTVSTMGELRDQAKDVYQALLMSIAWNCCREDAHLEEKRKLRNREQQRR